MGRKAKDPALNLLARQLEDIKFEPHADLESAVQSFAPEDLRRIKISSNYKSYHVRYFIGGAYRIIGYTKDPVSACRYADMAELRFWKYRARDPHPPADSDLHFGVEQAKADLETYTEAAVLLDNIEVYLRESGAIPDYKVLEAQRDTKQKKKETRRTVRGDMYGLFADVLTALDALSKAQADIKKCLDVLIDKQQGSPPPNFPASIDEPPVMVGGTDLFKRSEFTPPVNHSQIWQRDFVVNVPHPDKPNEVLKKILIQVPVRKDEGIAEWVLLPEAHELIEQTKRAHMEQYQKIMAQRKDLVDIFTPPTSTETTNQTNQ